MPDDAELRIEVDPDAAEQSGRRAGEAFADASEQASEGASGDLVRTLRELRTELHGFAEAVRSTSRGGGPGRSRPSPGRGGSRGGGSDADAQADSYRYKTDLLEEEDKLDFLKRGRAQTAPGSAAYERFNYDIAREKQRRERQQAREAARAEKVNAKEWRDQERQQKRDFAAARKAEAATGQPAGEDARDTERAWRSQEREQNRAFTRQQREQARGAKDAARHADGLRSESLRGMTSLERLDALKAEMGAAAPGSAEYRRAELGLAREETNRKLRPAKPPPLPKGGKGKGDASETADMLRSVLQSAGVASLLSGGGDVARGALTGDASSAMKGGIGVATGAASLAAGPYAPIVQAIGQAIQGVVGMLDGLVESLGKYNGRVLAAKAQLTIDEFKYRKEMADATADLQVEWIELKREAIGLMRDLRPEIQTVIDAIRELVAGVRYLTSGFRQVNDATNGSLGKAMFDTALPGAGLLSMFGGGGSGPPAAGGSAQTAGGGPGFLASAANGLFPGAGFLFGGGGSASAAPATPSGGPRPAASSGGGLGDLLAKILGGSGADAPVATPAWNGVGFSQSNNFSYVIQDRESVERAAEEGRRRLVGAHAAHVDRVESIAAAMDGRNAVALMG